MIYVCIMHFYFSFNQGSDAFKVNLGRGGGSCRLDSRFASIESAQLRCRAPKRFALYPAAYGVSNETKRRQQPRSPNPWMTLPSWI